MNCLKCGQINESGASVCIKCGNQLNVISPETPNLNEQVATPISINNESVSSQNSVLVNDAPQQPNEQPAVSLAPVMAGAPQVDSKLNIISYIINVLLKPSKTYKEEEQKLSIPQNAFLLTVIMSGIMVGINIITTLINTVIRKELDLSTFKYKTVVDFKYVGDIKWLELIFKRFIIYFAIILIVAAIYYVFALVFKKKTNYIKILSMTATSIIPMAAVGMLAAQILGLIWAILKIIVLFVGIVYSFFILIHLINDEMKFEDIDSSIYYHTITISVMFILCEIIVQAILSSAISKLL